MIWASAVQQDEGRPLTNDGGVQRTLIAAVVSELLHGLPTHSDRCVVQCLGPSAVEIYYYLFGTRSSGGCIRVPADALHQLTQVPLGTVVLIDNN